MTTRIILWGVPMCLSTVFTRCMNARGDTEIFMEPYDNCHSFGPERRISWPDQMRSAELLNDWQTYEYTQKLLEREDHYQASIVFAKDMAYAVEGKYDMLPKGYRHTFIVRDPVKVWVAYHRRIRQLLGDKIELRNGGDLPGDLESYASQTSVYKASFDLMEYTRTVLNQAPVIIDADDLTDHPEATLRRYCLAVGIPFKDKMLSFGSSGHSKDELDQRWHCSKFFTWGEERGGFYTKAMESKGFVSDKKEYKISDLPPEVVECVTRSKDWYEKLHALRLKPE
ncbi:uncharacterized protein LOC110974515 [Acanthaster planci]|uniref:Uncharacterized protein LOC110974515 n=1 Tax=Acanthaster planci TaxID=133434 RepID=A0A8B7XPI2_ACAPL|nr:uncharacterized protein LOC110974515 [Acanthaster planci]XP_022081906.1 uncharacterized protein LOC110974515 [Acanthaster planci]